MGKKSYKSSIVDIKSETVWLLDKESQLMIIITTKNWLNTKEHKLEEEISEKIGKWLLHTVCQLETK